MELSIVIVNYNVYEDIKLCIESIYKFTKNISFEIIVVDNNSPDRAIDNISKDFPTIKYIALKSNNGFGFANNRAMELSKGEYFLLINPDIIIQDDTINKMLEYMKNHPKTGSAGSVQIKPSEGYERYYCFFPSLYSRFAQEFGLYMKAPLMKYRFFNFWDNNIASGIPFKVAWVIGSCIMLRREVFDKLSGFNEAFFLYEEEVDWQCRMNKAGWESVIIPECKVLHNHHSSTSKFGTVFIYFHEFRSRIVFSNLHDKFLKRWVRKIMIFSALSIRIGYNYIWFFSPYKEMISRKITVFWFLLKFNLGSKSKIVNDRFSFENFSYLFEV
jgi:GT2 family glycosyltransferase